MPNQKPLLLFLISFIRLCLMGEMRLNSDAQVQTGCQGNKLEMSKQDVLASFVPK